MKFEKRKVIVMGNINVKVVDVTLHYVFPLHSFTVS